MTKNPAAVDLGKRRFASMTAAEQREAQGKAGRSSWASKSPAERKAHIAKMVKARRKSLAQKKIASSID